MLKRFFVSLGFAVFAAAALAASGAAGNPVLQDLNFGRANDALSRLDAALAANANDAQDHNYRCRVYLQEELWDEAIADCEAAVRTTPESSDYHLWLGRAYGEKAEHASLLSAYKLARKVAAEFQTAVKLDPRNEPALADLGEFDASAPSVVGGGLERAAAVVPQLQALNPAAALTLAGRIAEAQKNYGAAEVNLKGAIAESSNPAENWMDLAAFYKRRGRQNEMVAAVHSGASADRLHDSALVDGATDLISAGLEPETAVRWLQQYLASGVQCEDAPAFAVRAQLARVLSRQGQQQAAEEQLAAVHSLASGYAIPASNTAARAGQ